MTALGRVIGSWFMVHGKKKNILDTNHELRTHNQPGFSLVEILVAVSIIVLLGVIAIPSLRQFSKEQEIDSVALQVLNTLKTAQSSASSRIKCPNSSNEPADTWTVQLNTNSYSLIATCQSSSQTIFTRSYLPSESYTTDTFSGSLNVCTAPGGLPVDIIFSRSRISYLCNGSSTVNTENILLTITNSSGSLSKIVKIDQGGVIKIE